jgi:hypothetical protein
MVEKEYSHLLNKKAKLLTSNEVGKISVYSGKIIFVGDIFLSIHDEKTNLDITVPVERILQIESIPEGEP